MPVNTAAELDRAFWIHLYFTLWRLGYSQTKGAAAFHDLMILLPAFKRQCPTTLLALRGWGRLVPPESHPPLTWPLALAIDVHVRMRWNLCCTLSVAVLVQFDALPRIGERNNHSPPARTTLHRAPERAQGSVRWGVQWTCVSPHTEGT